jgi:cytochrome P450
VFANARGREKVFDLVTFSAGPGRCLGQEFNMLEFFLVLDAVLRRYDVSLVDPDAPVRDSDAEISGPEPGSLIVRIRARRPSLSAAKARWLKPAG